MVSSPTPRTAFMDALAAEITHNYGRGRRVVAVDGVADTTVFADDLGVALREAGHPVIRASLADFLLPRASREQRGADSPEGFYDDRFDYATFQRVLVHPFRMGGSAGFVTASFDASRDRPLEPRWKTAPADAVLLIDGPFLQRPELRGIANFVVYLEPGAGAGAGAGTATGPGAGATGANALYQAAVGPRAKSDAIVQVTDGELPKRVFADRC
jgi:uridine kinase